LQFEQNLKIFQTEHDFIKHKVPYRNFVDLGDVAPVCYDSKIGLVIETYFDNEVITYSEKIFRALQIPRPWLLFCSKYAVKNLRLMGFDVLDDVIDHNSYDELDLPTARQTQILDLLLTYRYLTIDDTRLKRAAQHNQNLLKGFAKSWSQDIMHAIDTVADHA
jgi:hypothetical protein